MVRVSLAQSITIEHGRLIKRTLAQIFDQIPSALADKTCCSCFQRVHVPILFRHCESWDKDGIVEASDRLFFQVGFRDVVCLFLIECQKPLVKVGFHGKDRFIAKENLEESQLRDVPAHQDQAHSKWSRKNQTYRAPQDCPEHSRYEDGERGNSRVGAV